MKCTAKNRRGEQCGNHAVGGTTKCKFHGGASLIGVASKTFKTGRYSKHIPTRLAARYAEALADPQLMELRDEIGLIQTRQTELLEQLDTGLSLARWRAAQSAYGDLMVAMGEKDSAGLQRALLALEDALIAPVNNDYAIWDEVMALTEQRRKLVDSEQKRLAVAQQLISAEQMLACFDMLT